MGVCKEIGMGGLNHQYSIRNFILQGESEILHDKLKILIYERIF